MISEPLAWLQQLDDDVLPKRLAVVKVQDVRDWLGDLMTGYVQALQHLEARFQSAEHLQDRSVCAVWLQHAWCWGAQRLSYGGLAFRQAGQCSRFVQYFQGWQASGPQIGGGSQSTPPG